MWIYFMFVEEIAKFKVHCHRKHGTMESPLPITTFRGFPSELGQESPEMLRLRSLFTQRQQSQFQQSSKFEDQINVDVSIRRVKLSGALVILMYNQTNGRYCCCSMTVCCCIREFCTSCIIPPPPSEKRTQMKPSLRKWR